MAAGSTRHYHRLIRPCVRGSVALCAWVLLVPVCCGAATLHETVKKGADLYAQGKYDEALNAFVDGQIEHPEDAQLKYNIASSKYMMKNYEEALKGYLDVAATARDARLEEKALFNAGNALYRQGKLEESIEYYKKALELDPADKDAQQNIEFVREEIKRRMNEAKDTQQKQQEQEQKKDQTCRNPQQDNQTQSDGQQQEQKQEGQQAQQEQQQEQQQKQEGRQFSPAEDEKAPQDESQQGASEDIREMTKEEAQQWLDSVRENRDNLKEGRQPARTQGGARSGKDW
ncbi:MAG: tetratricopeptide repeat protein [Deltaproteobacteria bacterium]|nr:tetratricopeptide repeat protein [Deltaproteobacteria bacterium]